jgi:hypothetical protein
MASTLLKVTLSTNYYCCIRALKCVAASAWLKYMVRILSVAAAAAEAATAETARALPSIVAKVRRHN